MDHRLEQAPCKKWTKFFFLNYQIVNPIFVAWKTILLAGRRAGFI